MNKNKEEDKHKKLVIFNAIAIVLVLWIVSWLIIDYFIFPKTFLDNQTVISERGAFGDKFGFVNSLFSGLALTGIIISIYFQQKELSLQRDELIETREEFKDQNFQTTFFNLLKTQRQLAEEIKIDIWDVNSSNEPKKTEITGRFFFNNSKSELRRILNALDFESYVNYFDWKDYSRIFDPSGDEYIKNLDNLKKISYSISYYKISKEIWEDSKNLDKIELARISYGIFLHRFHFVMGHYFRHLYHILNFLEEKETERKIDKKDSDIQDVINEYQTYANFIQAQMTTPELFLLFYNSLSFPKLQSLLIRYNILENLAIEDLILKEHNCVQGINLKSRSELLK
ncbi:putative phage abortive infection protein [Psychroserpens sp. Hel_I_66]|uniref:putative phage abortive infection protein n=1 Tax=Psychroserpens sp. Hel_I_66 TaxID=1250004 RepID=UPI0006477389|nr:putative phage abortive infection protein [Psychroserpens sp. Hel_I_66]